MKGSVKILAKAKEKLETVGWVQGLPKKYSSDGEIVGYCAVGALFEAAREGKYSTTGLRKSTAYNAALDCLTKVTEGDSIIAFNDAPKRTKEEVLKLFDTAIECAQN